MAQQQLDVCEFQLLLQEDDIKKEVPDIIKLSCFYCGTAEDVDIKDSNKNTCPFICSGCYTIENCENASEDTATKVEVITLINWIQHLLRTHCGTIDVDLSSPIIIWIL